MAFLLRLVGGSLYYHYVLGRPFRRDADFLRLWRADSMIYNSMAQGILTGHGFSHQLYDYLHEGVPVGGGWFATAHYAPLYPLFLATSYRLLGTSFWAVLVPQAMLGALSCSLIYLLAARLFGNGVGVVAASLVALHPQLIVFTTYIVTETGYVCLLILCLLLLYWFLEMATSWRAIVTGLVCGLTALWRPAFLVLLPFLLAAALIRLAHRQSKAGRNVLTMAGCVALVITPWVLRNYVLFHEVIPISTEGGQILWQQNNPDLFALRFWESADVKLLTPGYDLSTSEPARKHLERAGVHTEQGYIKAVLLLAYERPADYLRLSAQRLMWLLAPFRPKMGLSHRLLALLVYLAVFPLSMVGLVLAWRDGRNMLPLVALLIAVLLEGAFIAGDWSNRLRLPIEPILCMLASYGFFRLHCWPSA